MPREKPDLHEAAKAYLLALDTLSRLDRHVTQLILRQRAFAKANSGCLDANLRAKIQAEILNANRFERNDVAAALRLLRRAV